MKSGEVVRRLKDAGFKERPGKGSHRVFKHPDGRSTVVPHHAGEDLKKGTLKGIEKQSGVSMK